MFERGAISKVGPEAHSLGDRILLICTPTLKASAAAKTVRDSLGGALVAEFNGVAPHVPREAVEAARDLAHSRRVDVVVAIGGGSAIGVGKWIAVGDIPSPALAIGGGERLPGERHPEGIPLIAIPTTYAGSEMTPMFGVTDWAEGRKRVQRDPAALPRLAIYDPEVTLDLSPELTASTGMNALAHCVEAVYARDATSEVRQTALDGISRISRSLPVCVVNGRDIDAREDLLRGAYLAGLSIAHARMGLHHGLCHVLGGRTGVAHGVLNAIVLPHVMRFNAEAVPDAMRAIAAAMDAGDRSDDAQAAPRFTKALVESLPVPKRLRDAGVSGDILESVAAEAASSATVKANPRPASQTDILSLLREAW